jgi:hypothetical protein
MYMYIYMNTTQIRALDAHEQAHASTSFREAIVNEKSNTKQRETNTRYKLTTAQRRG